MAQARQGSRSIRLALPPLTDQITKPPLSRSARRGSLNEAIGPLAFGAARCILQAMSILFDQTDFSVVVKNRASPPKPWRWEIYRAGRNSPIGYSSVLYETMAAANRAGKEALK